MSKKYKPTSTLEYYNFRETNQMAPVIGPSYKVKVSDKDGNIITIEKDDALYACVSLAFDKDTGILSLLDVAHENSILAEIEMPNADYIYNCRYNEELNSILFDVKSLYGNETSTIELDVESLVELYEAGQGIEIGEKSEETGRKPISIKLAEGESLLRLSESGLSISDEVVTDDEVSAAISGKADIDYVNELFDSVSGATEKIDDILDDIDVLSGAVDTINEQLTDIDDEISELSDDVETLKEGFNTLTDDVNTIKTNINVINDEIDGINNDITSISGSVDVLSGKLDTEIEERKAEAVADVIYDLGEKKIIFKNFNDAVIAEVDATDFIKDGMIDDVELVEIAGDTYLHIVFNTDAGKEAIDINIGDIFNSDNYYTKPEIDEKVTALQEMDAALANVDTQQWAVINQNRADMETVDGQLWAAIGAEASTRENVDNRLWSAIGSFQAQIDVEKATREQADTQLADAIATERGERIAGDAAVSGMIQTAVDRETQRATGVEAILSGAIDTERTHRIAGDEEFFGKVEAEKERAEEVEGELRRAIADEVRDRKNAISGFAEMVVAEQAGRELADTELGNRISAIENAPYATEAYVNQKDAETLNTAVSSAVTNANSYTDGKIDTLDANIREYIDIENTNLQKAISKNTTKINAISNLRGVTEQGDTTNYDDSGNGILDVLHKEFHNLINGLTEQQIVGLLADMLRRIEALENA